MELIHGFNASGTFYDDVNFPYGFSKSGFFSIPESELLETLGRRLCALEQGTADPANQVEENFVEFCQSNRDPVTRVERVWVKYKKHATRKSTVTLGSMINDSADKESYDGETV